MINVAVLLIFFAATGIAQNCIRYGGNTTITGRLLLQDESGYNQFIVLKPVQPICVVANPNDSEVSTSEYYRRRDNVAELQTDVYGDDASSETLRSRLKRLIGHIASVKGNLFPATTGYHRTDMQFRVVAVEPVDPKGEEALRLPTVPFQAKNIEAYDVTLSAGSRLIVEAHQTGSEMPLTPVEEYAPHWMTGGEVVYIGCRYGYERHLISTSEKGGLTCGDEGLCGLVAFPKTPIMIKFQCIRKP
jgi:hypothetical protein